MEVAPWSSNTEDDMNPSSQIAGGNKRKVAFDRPALTSQARKRQKNQDARSIPIQRGTSVPANGELNIASFIKAREFEISALDKSMRSSRNALSSRAFQQVPRHLRRRTASHNAKKVPRRLRRRAEREVSATLPCPDASVLTMADQDDYR